MTITAVRRTKVFDDYLELVNQFPPRPIKDEAHYDATVAVMDRLAIRDESTLSESETDYLEALATFVEDYDRRHHPMPTKKGSPLQRLKFLMRESGMTTADLGRLLGNSSLASKLVKGQRELSKAHIRVLADHFKVNPALFL